MSSIATSVVATAATTSTAASSTATAAIPTTIAPNPGRGRIAVEIRLSFILVEIGAAFDCHGGSLGSQRRGCFTAAHLGALLLEDSLTRQADAVPFHRQNFHQHLVALFQFIANVLDAMLGNLTDVQEPVSSVKCPSCRPGFVLALIAQSLQPCPGQGQRCCKQGAGFLHPETQVA